MTPLFVDTNCILYTFLTRSLFYMRIFKQKIFRVEYFEYLWQTLSPLAFIYRKGLLFPFLKEKVSNAQLYCYIVYIVSELKPRFCVAEQEIKLLVQVEVQLDHGEKHNTEHLQV